MQNNSNHGLSKCEPHAFSLKAVHKDRRPNLTATVLMCHGKQQKGKKNNSKCSRLEAPLFNRDNCHATPAFILPSEKNDYAASTRDFLRDHEKKVRQYEEQPQELLIPKPRSKNMYCNVCREGYEEYLQHIRSPTHRASIRSCPFNTHILELQRGFRSSEQRQLILSSSETGTPLTGDDEGQLVGLRGRKRVKAVSGQVNNAGGLLLGETNQNYTLTGSTQNLFYSQGSFPNPFEMMSRFNDCRGFYGPCGTMGFNSYFPYLQQNTVTMGYPMYCMPYQPMMTLQIFQQQH